MICRVAFFLVLVVLLPLSVVGCNSAVPTSPAKEGDPKPAGAPGGPNAPPKTAAPQ
jgi:hypothetical protein